MKLADFLKGGEQEVKTSITPHVYWLHIVTREELAVCDGTATPSQRKFLKGVRGALERLRSTHPGLQNELDDLADEEARQTADTSSASTLIDQVGSSLVPMDVQSTDAQDSDNGVSSSDVDPSASHDASPATPIPALRPSSAEAEEVQHPASSSSLSSVASSLSQRDPISAAANVTDGESEDSSTNELQPTGNNTEPEVDDETDDEVDAPVDNSSAPQSSDRPQFIRIGELQAEDDSEEGVTMTYTAVADLKDWPTTIRYLSVRTWDINRVFIGDYDNGENITESIQQTRFITPDPPFSTANSRRKLDEAVSRVVTLKDNGQGPPEEVFAPYWTTPTEDAFNGTPRPMRKPKKKHEDEDDGEIDLVMVVIDMCERMPGPSNFTSMITDTLARQQTFAEVHDWALQKVKIEGETLARTLRTTRRDEWSAELWVLPQNSESTPGSYEERTVYNWTKQPRLCARDFLDSVMWRQSRRTLYMELRIVDKPGSVSS